MGVSHETTTKRDVKVRTRTLPSPDFTVFSGPGIEPVLTIAGKTTPMETTIEDVGVMVGDVLDTVAVVNVPERGVKCVK